MEACTQKLWAIIEECSGGVQVQPHVCCIWGAACDVQPQSASRSALRCWGIVSWGTWGCKRQIAMGAGYTRVKEKKNNSSSISWQEDGRTPATPSEGEGGQLLPLPHLAWGTMLCGMWCGSPGSSVMVTSCEPDHSVGG